MFSSSIFSKTMCSKILEAMYILVNISKSERVTRSHSIITCCVCLFSHAFRCRQLVLLSTSTLSIHFSHQPFHLHSGLVFFDNFCSLPPSPRIILLPFTLNLELEYFTLYLKVKGTQLCWTLWPMDYI